MEPAAAVRIAAIIADIMVERPLPPLLEAAARDEHHVRVLEARHVAAEIAAVPRRLHVRDHLPDRALLGGGVVSGRPGAGGEEEKRGKRGGPHENSSQSRVQPPGGPKSTQAWPFHQPTLPSVPTPHCTPPGSKAVIFRVHPPIRP